MCTLRTKEEHISMCNNLETTGSLVQFEQLSKDFGINYRSSLFELDLCDPCCGVLVPDIMHDVLEGVLQYELKPLFLYLVYDIK